MIELVQFLKELGSTAIDLFWLPVALWTGTALIAAVVLNYATDLAAIYQYHVRVAVLAALPAGIAAAPLIHWLLSSNAASGSSAIIVIQNPLPITVASTAQAGIAWSDPALWVGLATAGVILVALAATVKLLVSYIQLKLFIDELKNKPAEKINDHITVYLSDAIETPCTFGRREKCVVIPEHLKERPEKYKMALRHERMHIQNNDYPINSFLQVIKALFYFHPSVHYLIRQADEYREIVCDTQVLSNTKISQKSYAGLLYELAPKPVFKNTVAMNMAVNPSTLKKRIQMMKKQTHITPSFKQSAIIALLLAFTLTGFMACSDVTDNGLTVSEVKKVQRKAANTHAIPTGEQPLYVVNGEILDSRKRNIISRLKTKYIQSIHVLKGEKAIEAYGKAGKNGVIEIQLYNKEKAFNDLLPAAPKAPDKPSAPQKASANLYLTVDDMPELKNPKAFYSHFEYPKKCKKAGVEGTVYVQFIVTKTGQVTDVEVIRGIGHGCDQAAVNFVKQYATFTPGTQNGEPVNVRFTLPVMYTLN